MLALTKSYVARRRAACGAGNEVKDGLGVSLLTGTGEVDRLFGPAPDRIVRPTYVSTLFKDQPSGRSSWMAI